MSVGVLFSLVFSPIFVEAGFLSSFFGDEVYAQENTDFSKNSQTVALLQANVLPVPTSKSSVSKDEVINQNVDVNIVSDTALLPKVNQMGGTADSFLDFSFDEVSVYVVRSGDTLSQVATMFGVSVDTILSANDMKKGDKLKEGDILLILPFSGIEHTVVKGQTLQGIANLYKVNVDDILFSNDIDIDTSLAIGDKLIIPDASMPNDTPKPATIAAKSSFSKLTSYPSTPTINATGYFINPVPGARKTRGTSATHKGVDLAAPIGTTIFAAASGLVSFARTGYNGGFGNLVIISHDNGTKTLYAHQSRVATSVGARVSQGDVIGFVGNTGRSRGAHLHFEVQGAKNPGNDWSWKK